MLNKKLIFVNGFFRGGTNILMNIIHSHPNVTSLDQHLETNQVFDFGESRHNIIFKYAIVLIDKMKMFRPYDLTERQKISKLLQYYIDLMLYIKKEDKKSTILLCKNATGLVMDTDLFLTMYPDAKFIALVRDGLPLCEGLMRRGFTAKQAGETYKTVCEKMIHYEKEINNYTIVRFEDAIQHPVDFIKTVYDHLDLNIGDVDKFRLSSKKSMSKDGTRDYTVSTSYDRELCWYKLDDVHTHFRSDVNKNQLAQLSSEDKEVFLDIAQNSMNHFGYS